jgi:hypothetical protein
MGAAAVGGSEPVVTGAAAASPDATYTRDGTIDLSIVAADFSTRRRLEALPGSPSGPERRHHNTTRGMFDLPVKAPSLSALS